MCFFLHSCKVSYKQFFQVSSLFAIPQFWLWYINLAILRSFDFPVAVIITKIITVPSMRNVTIIYSLSSAQQHYSCLFSSFPQHFLFQPYCDMCDFSSVSHLEILCGFSLLSFTWALLAMLPTFLLLFLTPPILLFCHWQLHCWSLVSLSPFLFFSLIHYVIVSNVHFGVSHLPLVFILFPGIDCSFLKGKEGIFTYCEFPSPGSCVHVCTYTVN